MTTATIQSLGWTAAIKGVQGNPQGYRPAQARRDQFWLRGPDITSLTSTIAGLCPVDLSKVLIQLDSTLLG